MVAWTHATSFADFLASRRAKLSPEQAGLPVYGGNRRVAGLRREEVALLAGVSVPPGGRAGRDAGRAHRRGVAAGCNAES